ncbi:hypothetical protein F2P81_009078 [Scophthalmus maximus]|uniref:Uncharacterized protein n=1 Tax=Scophthalmus maximus TaxID=52904 RepID=A0A6A4T5V8_SCOMX|nr:hypothetical protein F2P81_009078 [Scophthalmus maximus]
MPLLVTENVAVIPRVTSSSLFCQSLIPRDDIAKRRPPESLSEVAVFPELSKDMDRTTKISPFFQSIRKRDVRYLGCLEYLINLSYQAGSITTCHTTILSVISS